MAHTNKKTGQIQDPVIKGVVDLVEAEIATQSQPLSDDGDSTGASTNLSLLQINEMVEKVIFFINIFFFIMSITNLSIFTNFKYFCRRFLKGKEAV